MVEVLSQRRIKPRRLRPYLLYTLPAHTCKCGELLAYSPDRREGSFSEIGLPRAMILGNRAYLTREEGCSAVAKARRESGSTTNTMLRTATTSPTATTAFSAAPGAMITPGAPESKLSTQTTMVAQ